MITHYLTTIPKVSLMADYATYITVINNLDFDLHLIAQKATLGSWGTNPPQRIFKKTSSGQFKCDAASGSNGSEGWFTYDTQGSILGDVDFTVNFSDPWGVNTHNTISLNGFYSNLYELSYRAKSGDNAWQNNKIQTSGHPLYLEITISYKVIVSSISLQKINAVSDFQIQNTYGNALPLSNTIWDYTKMNNDGVYSKNPVLWKVNLFKSKLDVIVNVDTTLLNFELELVGKIDGVKVFSGYNRFYGVGINTAQVKYDNSNADKPLQAYGDIEWTIVTASNNVTLKEKTRVEIYWIYDKPGKMFTTGVWVNIYRKIFQVLKPRMFEFQVTEAVAKQCFSGFGMKYDTVRGAPHFGMHWWGGAFYIKRYYNKTHGSTLNCYDQAGFAQLQLSALGIIANWLFMDPFGFINETNLIGVSYCNNPFFNNSAYTNKAIVPINDPKRSMFGNHAFVSTGSSANIVDACQGPVVGLGTLSQYISKSIDHVTTLYSKFGPPNNKPGTTGDAAPQKGVSSLDMSYILNSTYSKKEEIAMKELLDINQLSTNVTDDFLLVNIDDLLSTVFKDYSEIAEDVNLADIGSIKTVSYEKEDERRLIVRVHVARSERSALEFMRHYLSSFSLPPALTYVKAPEEFGNMAIQDDEEKRPSIHWIFKNIYITIDGNECDPKELFEKAAQLNAALKSGKFNNQHNIPDEVLMHIILEPNPAVIKNGTYLTISFGEGMEDRIVCRSNSRLLHLDSTGPDYYKFLAKGTGKGSIEVYLAELRDYYLISQFIEVVIN